MTKTKLIWEIFSWLNFFNGRVKCSAITTLQNEDWILFETKRSDSTFSANLDSKADLLAANCVLTWWANMGVDNNENGSGENIFNFDLTKKVNRDKFVV